ncbi:MAG: type II CAAX endopeptidase family protein [Candidatus Alcyoniella australis]|nr:type II CAAX endopeptidase family protein [Candidatus Alcyoniella australis]
MKRTIEIVRKMDRRLAIVLIYAALAMTPFAYQCSRSFFLEHWGEAFAPRAALWYAALWHHSWVLLLFGLIPLAIVKLGFKLRLADFGVRLGDWKFGLAFLAIWVVLMLPGTYVNSMQPEFTAEYPLVNMHEAGIGLWLLWSLLYLVYYVGWEFFFRGFIQFSVERAAGPLLAIMMQTLPSTIIHIGNKPFGETFSAVIAGLLFGLVAVRTRSILWPLLAHWYVGMSNDWFCNMAGPHYS